MVVVDDDADVRRSLREPAPGRLHALEQRLPVRLARLAVIDRGPDGGDVGGGDTRDDPGHPIAPPCRDRPSIGRACAVDDAPPRPRPLSLAAVAFDRPPAVEQHLFELRLAHAGAGHRRPDLLHGHAVEGGQLEGVVDVAAEAEQAQPVAFEHRLALCLRHRIPVQAGGLVRPEGRPGCRPRSGTGRTCSGGSPCGGGGRPGRRCRGCRRSRVAPLIVSLCRYWFTGARTRSSGFIEDSSHTGRPRGTSPRLRGSEGPRRKAGAPREFVTT